MYYLVIRIFCLSQKKLYYLCKTKCYGPKSVALVIKTFIFVHAIDLHNEISSLNDLKLSLHKLRQLISSKPTILKTGDFNFMV